MEKHRIQQDPHELEKAQHKAQNEAWLSSWSSNATLTVDELGALEQAAAGEFDDDEHPSRAA